MEKTFLQTLAVQTLAVQTCRNPSFNGKDKIISKFSISKLLINQFKIY